MKESCYIPYKNVAGAGLISLTAAWCVFDAFAFFVQMPFIAAIGLAVTLMLCVLTIVIKVKEFKINKKNRALYEENRALYRKIKEENEIVGGSEKL